MASLRYTMGAGPVPQLQLNPDDPDTEDGCPLPDPMAEVQLPDLQRNRERACEPSPKTAAWAPARNPLHGLREGDSDEEDAGARDPAASQGSGRGARGAAQQVRTYVTFATRDMRRRKLSCCLGCASCWLVVFCMSILLSLLRACPAHCPPAALQLRTQVSRRVGGCLRLRRCDAGAGGPAAVSAVHIIA